MNHAAEFIEFAIDHGVLRFGEFTLKSGRDSPYFFNVGAFCDGGALSRLGRFYARAIADSGIAFDMLFGPAYKGIPLAAATAIAFADVHGRNIGYAFNRKEAKDHGEGGEIVGAPLAGRVLIVDDVITAGTALREAIDMIKAAGAAAVGVAVSFDRQEKGQGDLSAIEEARREFGVEVVAVASLTDLLAYARSSSRFAEILPAIERYGHRYSA
ncbi:MAG: orotate phosphoribosyltransferase [Gammaproteobacteria bacterium]